jgi:diacylglycerol kinase family enzyme
MQADILAERVRFLLSRSLILPGARVEAHMIGNPRAGGFTRPLIWKRHLADLEALSAEASALSERLGESSLELHLTERAGHAAELAAAILARPRRPGDGELLFITSGGDGTAWEVQTALMRAAPETRASTYVLRLPMGTGNDGSDGRSLDAALGRLLRPIRVEARPAVRLRAVGISEPHYAFNIASLGLDAFVTHMTNKLKGRLPGDSYKLWLDIASVFYDLIYRVGPMRLRLSLPGGEARREQPYEIVVMGVSGRRTYGSNVHILPGQDNVCVIRKAGLARKLALKAAVGPGLHRGMPEVEFFNSERIDIDYDGPVLAQFDGEVLPLEPDNFPVVMELTEPVINTLQYA